MLLNGVSNAPFHGILFRLVHEFQTTGRKGLRPNSRRGLAAAFGGAARVPQGIDVEMTRDRDQLFTLLKWHREHRQDDYGTQILRPP
jgi:hypothetical protein